MTNEELKAMDFGESLKVLIEASETLGKLEVNHLLIGEITNADGTYSKYTSLNKLKLDPSDIGEDDISQTNKDLITNHLGGIVAVVFDFFADAFELSYGRTPDFQELLAFMVSFHQKYIQNVQP